MPGKKNRLKLMCWRGRYLGTICTEFALASGCLSTFFCLIVKQVPIGLTNLFFRNEKTIAGVEKKNCVRVRWKETDATFQSARGRLTAKRRSNEILALHKLASERVFLLELKAKYAGLHAFIFNYRNPKKK